MAIPVGFRREPPPGVLVERETGAGAVEFAARAYPHWVDELDRGDRTRHCVRGPRRDGATIGFGCHSCNRAAWIGPMATDPDAQHGGIGSAVARRGVRRSRRPRGTRAGEISWVSNLRFYGKCGATVSRVFQGGQLALT